MKKKMEDKKIGDKIDVSSFIEGEKVSVSGISKGKGFAGVVKRWGFAGRPKPGEQSTKKEDLVQWEHPLLPELLKA